MDTFGRLPTDVLNTIDTMCQKPILDIIIDDDRTYLVIKYPYTTQKINLKRSFYYARNGYRYCDGDKLYELEDFIQHLKDNKPCRYIRSYCNADHILHIFFDGNDIKIYTKDLSEENVVLDKACIGIFIDVMQKHYDYVNDHKK